MRGVNKGAKNEMARRRGVTWVHGRDIMEEAGRPHRTHPIAGSSSFTSIHMSSTKGTPSSMASSSFVDVVDELNLS